MAIRLGEAVGLGAADMRKLIIGAFLHDVGKIGIPDHILLKPGRLTEDEFEVMKTHVRHGLDIVSTSRWLNVAGEVVGNHHEKYDGTGYPRGVSVAPPNDNGAREWGGAATAVIPKLQSTFE